MIVSLATLAESYWRSLARAQVRSLLSSRTATATVPWRDDSTVLMSRDIRAASSGLRVDRQAAGTWAVLALAATADTGASSAETTAVAMAVRRLSMLIPMPASLRSLSTGGVFARATRVTVPSGG